MLHYSISVIRSGSLTVALLAMLVSGCATMSDGTTVTVADDARILNTSEEGFTPDEARLLQRSKKYARWRVNAMTVGTIGGILTGMLVAGSGNRGAGAAIGGIAGAQLGYLGGAYLANLNEQAEARRDTLEGQLAAADAALAETRDAVAVSRQMVRTEQEKIDRLNAEYQAGRIQMAQYEDEIDTLEAKVRTLEAAINDGDRDLQAMEQVAVAQRQAGADATQIESRIAELRGEVNKMRQARRELIAAIGTIPQEIDKPSVAEA